MTIKWEKMRPSEGFALDWERIFLIPTEFDGVQIFYGDEFCIVKSIGVQELVNKFKAHTDQLNMLTDRLISKTEVKIIIEKIIKENNNEIIEMQKSRLASYRKK